MMVNSQILGVEDDAGEGAHQTVANGEGEGGDAHEDALTGGEPLADDDADTEHAVDVGQNVDQEVADHPDGAGGQGGNQNGSDQRSQTEAQSHGLDGLHLTDEVGQNQLDHDTDQRAGSVNGGNLSCAAVHVGQHVHGEVTHGLEQKESGDLEDHQHPTAETEVDAELGFLLHTITPQK